MVGLTSVADQRAGKFSLGMSQRLGIAAALLGDPEVLLFDEPVNGLDPDGIRWVRHLLRGLAAEGRTVFVSSHLMSEMALTADEVVIIGRGRLIAQVTVDELFGPELAALRPCAFARAHQAEGGPRAAMGRPRSSKTTGRFRFVARTRSPSARLAAGIPVVLHELAPQSGSLEEAFMELTEEQHRVSRRAAAEPGCCHEPGLS